MPCCNCDNCSSDGECFPQDHDSLQKWRKDFNNLRQQWSDYLMCGTDMNQQECCQCCCCEPKLVRGRFGLAWISETPKKKCCSPCGWQLEICDTPSRVECQCQKMEAWASCPPVEGCNKCCVKPRKCGRKKCCSPKKPRCCSPKRSRCCSPKRSPCCSIKVMPFVSQEECCCRKCASGGTTNDKAIATDNCICNESKATNCPSTDQNTDNDQQGNNNNDNNNPDAGDDKTSPRPRARSRGRRRR